MDRRRLFVVGGLAVVLGYLAVHAHQRFVATGADRYVALWKREPFTVEGWRASDAAIRTGRFRMVPDLLSSRDGFKGWPRDSVVKLLDTGETFVNSAPPERPRTFSVYAGEDQDWNIDPERYYFLVFETDAAERVTEASFACYGSAC